MSASQLENPVTKGRFAIRHSETDLLRLEVCVPVDMIRPPLHVHCSQQESFQVLDGEATLQVGRNKHILGPGGRFAVPPGTPHTWWNSGERDLTMLAEFRPAGNAQSFFETFCGMAAEGRCNVQGSPPFLQIAASAPTWDMFLAGPPVAFQRALFAVLGPLARLRGYRASYDRFSAR